MQLVCLVLLSFYVTPSRLENLDGSGNRHLSVLNRVRSRFVSLNVSVSLTLSVCVCVYTYTYIHTYLHTYIHTRLLLSTDNRQRHSFCSFQNTHVCIPIRVYYRENEEIEWESCLFFCVEFASLICNNITNIFNT